jgi:NDP-sugar pyrophosphorylase family protein
MPGYIKQALLLAAGLGTRLRPLTDDRPKALVLCAGKPLLWHNVKYLEHQGITQIIVNVHHFSELLSAYIREELIIPGITFRISDESAELKDTGGAMVHALPLIVPDAPLLVLNTDIFTDLDIDSLLRAHQDSGADITLVLQERPGNRKLLMDQHLSLRGWINHSTGEKIQTENTANLTEWAFAGIHVINPAVIESFKSFYGNKPFPIIPAYLNFLNRFVIKGYPMPEASLWKEAGNPQRLEELEKYLR